MQKSFLKKINLAAIIVSLVQLYGCALIFPKKSTDFREDKADEVWSLTSSARESWCQEGKYNGSHISKVKIGGNDDAPLPNPEMPGKLSKQYIKYTIDSTMPSSKIPQIDTYGITFIFYAKEDGIIYRCDSIKERIH